MLNEVDLSGCDLTGVDISRTEMIDANLRHARLVTADLYKASLTAADLTGADLTGARLLRADLTDAIMNSATLDRTDLTKTFFLRTDLRRATLRNARLDRVGFDDDQVAGWDAAGAIGTVLAGSAVTDSGGSTDAIQSLRDAGAMVRVHQGGIGVTEPWEASRDILHRIRTSFAVPGLRCRRRRVPSPLSHHPSAPPRPSRAWCASRSPATT